jgi:hypothetical protein
VNKRVEFEVVSRTDDIVFRTFCGCFLYIAALLRSLPSAIFCYVFSIFLNQLADSIYVCLHVIIFCIASFILCYFFISQQPNKHVLVWDSYFATHRNTPCITYASEGSRAFKTQSVAAVPAMHPAHSSPAQRQHEE